MRVHRQTRDAERVRQHDIGGFASHARQLRQFFHGMRHFRAELFHQDLGRIHDISGFRPVITAGMNLFFQLFRLHRGKIFRTGMGFEQFRRNAVHHFIRALRGKNGCHQKLKWRFMFQKTFLRTILRQQTAVDFRQFCSKNSRFAFPGSCHEKHLRYSLRTGI